MARQAKSYTYFEAEVNGKSYEFKCWGTYGSHYCEDQDGRRSRYSYGNRPWENFRFETVLTSAIKKCPKGDQAELEAKILHKTKQEEAEKAEQQLAAFKKLHDGLSPENKKRMENYPMLQTEEDVHTCMAFMGLLTLMQN